jgi:hypothetical protein
MLLLLGWLFASSWFKCLLLLLAWLLASSAWLVQVHLSVVFELLICALNVSFHLVILELLIFELSYWEEHFGMLH